MSLQLKGYKIFTLLLLLILDLVIIFNDIITKYISKFVEDEEISYNIKNELEKEMFNQGICYGIGKTICGAYNDYKTREKK